MRYLLLLFCVLSVLSCDFFEVKKEARPKVAVQKKNIVPVVQEKSCLLTQEVLAPFVKNDSKTTNQILFLETQSQDDTKSEKDWIKAVVQDVVPKLLECEFESVAFRILAQEETEFVASVSLRDVKLFSDHKISLAEVVRRIGWQEKTILMSVKSRLQKARQKGDGDQAMKWIAEWQKQEPQAFAPRWIQSKIYFERRDYRRAQEVLEALQIEYPENWAVLFHLTLTWKNLGHFDKAEEFFQKLDMIRISSPEGWQYDSLFFLHRAEFHLLKQDYESAKKDLERVGSDLNLQKSFLLGKVLRFEKKYKEADKIFKKYPKDSNALFNRVLLALDQQDLKMARRHYAQLMKLDEKLAQELKAFEFLRMPKVEEGENLEW